MQNILIVLLVNCFLQSGPVGNVSKLVCNQMHLFQIWSPHGATSISYKFSIGALAMLREVFRKEKLEKVCPQDKQRELFQMAAPALFD